MVRKRSRKPDGAKVGRQAPEAEEIVVVTAVRAGESPRSRERRRRDVAPEKTQQALGAVDYAGIARELVKTVQAAQVDGRVGGAGILADAAQRRVQHEVVETLHARVEGVPAPIRLAQQHEVDRVHERDVRVGAAHVMAEAALDREFAQLVELRALPGREPVAVVAGDERTRLHAEVDGVVVHHESVAGVPAEVAVRAGLRISVLEFGGDVKQHVDLVKAPSRAQKVVDARKEVLAAEIAVPRLDLAHKAAQRCVGAGADQGFACQRRGVAAGCVKRRDRRSSEQDRRENRSEQRSCCHGHLHFLITR